MTREGLPGRIAAVLRLDADAPAIEQDGRWRSWGDVTAVVSSLDRHLADAGHGPGSAVAVVLRNRWALAATVLGLLATRRCAVVVSPIQSDERLDADLQSLAPAAVVADEEDWTRVPVGSTDALRLAVGGEGRSVRVVGPGARGAQVLDGVAFSMLTSGTTGPPKRVPQSFTALEAALGSARAYSAGVVAEGPRLSSGVTIVALPLSHLSGLWPFLQAVSEGRRVALLERFEPWAWADLVRRHRPPSAGLPPTPLKMVLDAAVPREWLASLKAIRVGSAHLPVELAVAFEDTYGIPALPIYGATEFGGSVAGLSLRDWEAHGAAKRGTVGRAQPGVELRVVDEGTGDLVPPGHRGLLEVRLDADGAGWRRTTDLGRLDEDGFLFVDGRADGAILRGGFKILPADVERVIEAHPDVVAAAVVGIADDRLGSVPVAAVVARPGGVTPAQLSEWCRSRLRPYEVPVAVRLVDALPETWAMKVDRAAVGDLLAPSVAVDR